MGVFEWIQQRLKGRKADPAEVPVEQVQPEPAPTPAPEKKAKKEATAEKPPRPPREKPPRKRKNKKKRKQPKSDPRLRKAADRPAKAPPASPPLAKAPTAPASPPLAKTPLASPPPAKTPTAPTSPPPTSPPPASPPDATAPPAPAPPRRPDTRGWIVGQKMDALLQAADAALASTDAPRQALVSARKRFERDWSALLPLPREDRDRLKAGHAERIAAFDKRIAALPDPKRQAEEASIAAREGLIKQAEALAGEPDVRAAIDTARRLQKAWQQTDRVPREQHAALSARWRAAMDAVYARRDAEQAERLKKLEGLVTQAELLVKTSDPVKAAEAMKGLQGRWKAIGGVRGEAGDALWKRFRGAADAIFAARREHIAAEQQANLKARQDLIAEVAALAGTGLADPEERIRHLHQRWKRIGRVPREQSDALWAEFKAACDRLHETPDIAPELLGDGEESLRFSPFAVLGDE